MVLRRRWWLEWELWLLVLLVGAIYLARLSDTPLTGEEPRRGQVAREMISSGDWIVPRQQGDPFLSRPPVQNWVIALVGVARGSIDPVAVRLPSAVAILLTVFLIYGYCRTFLSRLGAFSAAAAFPTMGLVLQFGWLGETEALYTLFVSGSLLAWRWADGRAKPAWWGWCAGYGLAALGMLTKGPQAPAYFVGGVGAFLLLSRRWQALLRWPHFVGVGLFLAGWAAWEVPFLSRVGAENAWQMFSSDIAMRFQGHNGLGFVKHLVTYPVEVAVCMLPWSILLLAYGWRDFRRAGSLAEEHARFLACCIGVAFLTCWLTPGARNRYFAPLFPCVAPLIGLVVERCCDAVAAAPWTRVWTRFLKGLGITMPAIGLWVLAATVLGWGPDWGAQPPAFAAVYVLAAAALGWLVWWSAARPRPFRHRLGILSVTAFLGLSWSGVMLNVFVAVREPIDKSIAELKQRLPEGARLVSIGPVDARFLFYYGETVRQVPSPHGDASSNAEWTYFCIGDGSSRPQCDFPHEQVAVISCHQNHVPHPSGVLIIGRRLPPPLAERSLPERVAEGARGPKPQVRR